MIGARRFEILSLTLGWGLKCLLAGTAIGLVMGHGSPRFIAGHLYEVSVMDPAVLSGVSVFLVAAGILAAYLPAQRASHIEPGRSSAVRVKSLARVLSTKSFFG